MKLIRTLVLVLAVILLAVSPVAAAARDMDLYCMFHCGGANVGDSTWFTAEELNPSYGQYNWSIVEARLDASVLPVHLFGIVVSLSPAGSLGYRDVSPSWWASTLEVTACGATGEFPAYNSSTWRSRYATLMRAFAQEYAGDSRIASFTVATGLDGEPQIAKEIGGCNWMTYVRGQHPDLEYRFGQWVATTIRASVIDWNPSWPAAYTGDPRLYFGNSTGGNGRYTRGAIVAGLYLSGNNIGLKQITATDIPDWDAWGSDIALNCGALSTMEYYPTVPRFFETKSGLGGVSATFWNFMSALTYEVDGFNLHPEHVTNRPTLPLGAFIAFRGPEYAEVSMGGDKRVSGRRDHWWLGMEETLDTATRVWQADLPAVTSGGIVYQAYYGDFAFDVKAGYEASIFDITYLDYGSATFDITWSKVGGSTGTHTVTRGGTNVWVEDTFTLDSFSNDDTSDIQVSGDVYLHMVELHHPAGEATPTPTNTGTPTSTPTGTQTPLPTATNTPTPTSGATLTMAQLVQTVSARMAIEQVPSWADGITILRATPTP